MAKKRKKEDFAHEKKKVKFSKLSNGDKLFVIANFIFLSLFVLVTMYPIINTAAVSLNEGSDALKGGIYFRPRVFTWDNYKTVLGLETIIQAAKITVLRTVIATFLHLFTTAMLAYVLCRKDFVFAKPVSLLYVTTMYVNGGIIPTLIVYKNLGYTNSFWVYIIPGMVSAFNMIVIRTFMKGLPESLFEAAEVDGAGHFTVFFKVVLPLCKPVLATVALFIAVYQWNSWFDVMLYNKTNLKFTTLQYELQKLLAAVTTSSSAVNVSSNASHGVPTSKSIRAAATIATALPIIAIYPFLQRYFVTGLTIGGIKE